MQKLGGSRFITPSFRPVGAPRLLAKASGIEPISAVLETAVLPLHHAPWNGRLGSNQHIRESKSRALPFGYTRIKADTREISRECLHAGNALARPLARKHQLPAVP